MRQLPISQRMLLAIIPLSLVACSQDTGRIHVNHKGHMFYGPNGVQAQSRDHYNPPRLATYHPDPYEPDFRARHGQVQIQAPTHYATTSHHSYAQPNRQLGVAPVESRELAAPQASWSPTQSSSRSLSSRNRSSFIPPVEANVISGYGKREDGSVNDGINYLIPAGEPVFASSDGTIAYVGDALKSYGNMVIIKHNQGYNSSYAHLGRATIVKGDQVRQGDIIGYVGQTGNAKRPQLHFGIRKGSDPVDPHTVLSKQLAAY